MGATEKVSLTIGNRELRLAKTAAERVGMSLSAFVSAAVERHATELAREIERQRAAHELISTFPPEGLATPDEARALRILWASAGPPPTEADIEAVLAGTPRRTRKREAVKKRKRASRA